MLKVSLSADPFELLWRLHKVLSLSKLLQHCLAQVIGLGAAIEYLENLNMEKINKYELDLLCYAEKKLKKLPNIKIYGQNINKGGIISFNLDNIHPHDVAHILDTSSIAIRAGHHCAQPIMKSLNVSATNRVSFALYNTKEEIDKLIENLIIITKLFS